MQVSASLSPPGGVPARLRGTRLERPATALSPAEMVLRGLTGGAGERLVALTNPLFAGF